MVTKAIKTLDTKGEDVSKDEIVNINHVDFCFRCVLFKPHLENLNP